MPSAQIPSTSDITCRLAATNEIHAAIALILGTGGKPATRSQVADFFQFATHRNIDVHKTWITLAGAEIVWAVLPMVSPGRTVLFFAPTHFNDRLFPVAGELISQMCAYFGRVNVQLAQVLIDPQQTAGRTLFSSRQFIEMGELIYLNGHAPRWAKPPQLPDELSWKTYSDQTHPLFARAILESYEDSLDCPALSGLRDIEDVIEGHKGTGEFDPALWQVLCEDQQPVGVLLLNKIPRTDSLELVYLGLSPHARHRGLGHLLMLEAMHQINLCGQRRLTLAVDSRNEPALKLYYSHGLQRLTAKVAMIRDLRPAKLL